MPTLSGRDIQDEVSFHLSSTAQPHHPDAHCSYPRWHEATKTKRRLHAIGIRVNTARNKVTCEDFSHLGCSHDMYLYVCFLSLAISLSLSPSLNAYVYIYIYVYMCVLVCWLSQSGSGVFRCGPFHFPQQVRW